MDLATPLYAALDRAVDGLIDTLAKEGLEALKRVIDRAKFSQSEYLKDHEIYAHVLGDSIEFEVVLSLEAIVPEDSETREEIEKQLQEEEDEKLERQMARTYGWSTKGPRRIRDARKAPRDARTSLRDARSRAPDIRTTARHRKFQRTVALRTPRSAQVTPEGKLSIALKRTVKETETEVRLPQGQFQGVVDQFMKELKSLITDEFAKELTKIVSRYVK